MTTSQTLSGKYCGAGYKCGLKSLTYIDEDDQKQYTTYGVLFTDNDGKVAMEINDISSDIAFVEQFIELCMSAQVSLLHVGDILADILP